MKLEAQLHSQLDRVARTVSHDLCQPAEWAPHRAVWTAWPSHEDLWLENIGPARKEFVDLCRAIADYDSTLSIHRGESLEILVADEKQLALAQEALAGLPVRFHIIPFGDIWLRDTGPVWVRRKNGSKSAVSFCFNGWGGKYDLPHDPEVSKRVSKASQSDSISFPWILEGGSVEVDGEGTCLTTRQCLLNTNRSLDEKPLTEKEVEERLKTSLGVSKVLWLNRGLANDHTDGHIDNLARFVSPGVVICMEARDPLDPNREVLEEIYHDLLSFTDSQGRKLVVVRAPSPGVILNEEGRVMPASYMNFYIGNSTVVVPTFGTRYDDEAIAVISQWFLGRKVVGRPSNAILSGGGSFHCITQQEPL